VETADSSTNTGSIELRSSSIGCVKPTIGQAYTASDILQTNPITILDPTYLASAGVQIGPAVDLVTKTAGGRGFSTYTYPTIIYYGLRGDIQNITAAGYLWPGTQIITGGSYPDTTTPAAYFRIQQPALLSGLSVGLNIAPGTNNSVTIIIRYTPNGGTIADTAFTVTLSNASVFASFYNASLTLNTGDRLHAYISYTGNNQNTAHDVTVQVDMF
jgi:hypothetical protein